MSRFVLSVFVEPEVDGTLQIMEIVGFGEHLKD